MKRFFSFFTDSVTKKYISNKSCSLKRSIQESITVSTNILTANVLKISELCDTEDWSNGYSEFSITF